jgi:hypothetical protein
LAHCGEVFLRFGVVFTENVRGKEGSLSVECWGCWGLVGGRINSRREEASLFVVVRWDNRRAVPVMFLMFSVSSVLWLLWLERSLDANSKQQTVHGVARGGASGLCLRDFEAPARAARPAYSLRPVVFYYLGACSFKHFSPITLYFSSVTDDMALQLEIWTPVYCSTL